VKSFVSRHLATVAGSVALKPACTIIVVVRSVLSVVTSTLSSALAPTSQQHAQAVADAQDVASSVDSSAPAATLASIVLLPYFACEAGEFAFSFTFVM
jgi:hypothetical protein